MKHAEYIYKAKFTSIHATVTLKDDGKVSVSLKNAKYGTTYGDRYQAKKLGHDIAAADFKHEAITSLKESKTSSKLITDLTEKSQDLKKQYIKATKEYCKRYFERCTINAAQPIEEWYKRFDIKYEIKPDFYQPGKTSIQPCKEEYNKKDLYKMRSEIEKCNSIVQTGYKALEEKEVMMANLHYTNSIQKLADRLHEKGITDKTEYKIKSGRVGVNIEMLIEHNGTFTKAWTIIAEGPIQRPHYRYLVK